MSSAPAALVYAELLSNIRQVSVVASLSTPSNQDTRAALSNDKQQLKLIHNGVTALLILPTQVAAVSSLQQLALGSQEISWRLALPSSASTNTGADFTDGVSAPWSASEIPEQAEVSCQKCGAILLAAGSIQSWKDLPSENWAEMMDFWHCHKPSVPKGDVASGHQENHLEKAGYGAKKGFMARSGVGLVDMTNFILSANDCCGIKFDHGHSKFSNIIVSREPIYCEQCCTTVGYFDEFANGLRFYKWSLSISTPTSNQRTAYPLSYFLTAHLLSKISSQAVNKFILHSTKPNEADLPILQVWVFAPYLTISRSTTGPKTFKPTPASKVFYRSISDKECVRMLENASTSVEEIELPAEVMIELAETLRRSTMTIPESARKFREWEVGFLERFAGRREE